MAKSKIIKDLANSAVDIQTVLKRTKVLLQELEDETILEWVKYEIEGYPNDVEVPEYRKIGGQLVGTYIKGSMASHMQYKNVSLPLGKMPEDQKEKILYSNLTQSIEALYDMAKSGEGICKQLPADIFPLIATYNNDPYMYIVGAEVKLNMSQVLSIFPKVESKLLDILCYLEKQFGNLDELDIDKESKTEAELEEIVQHIYVLIYNDNSVSIGNNNRIKDSNIVATVNE